MKTTVFSTRWVAIFLLSFFYLITTFSVEAGSLHGTVIGKNGQPKKYVRIEISGPESITLYTKEDGTFVVQLKGGKYIITIKERNKNMEFKVKVPKEHSKEKEFKLKW